ncbi:D-alanyl-D-alanine carboxypeptidase family protein [Ralstonia solanacearum]|uniref:D-alanyl-D-alanine carboxypeptidase family protein n=1 Tax=Ralstonia solanacearum TaxID=305 RepID=UPI0006DC0960|nr:D-alanyl-D-alanine carboxypeptidase family protein [Ralstonia solanacearum]
MSLLYLYLLRLVAFPLLIISMLPLAATAAPEPHVVARAYILIDGASHRVLLEKNADERLQPASLTKMMTAYVVLDALRKGAIQWQQPVRVEASDLAHIGGDEASMHLRAGEVITVQELFTGLIVVSANDAAMVLARTVGGSIQAFLTAMNDAARELGLHSSHFATPSGVTTADHYSTARDLALLSVHLTESFPAYLAFSTQRNFTRGSFSKHNKNRLLAEDPSVDGLKTGHTAKAGYCVAATAKRNVGHQTRRVFAVVLGAPSNDGRFIAGKALIDYGFQ